MAKHGGKVGGHSARAVPKHRLIQPHGLFGKHAPVFHATRPSGRLPYKAVRRHGKTK